MYIHFSNKKVKNIKLFFIKRYLEIMKIRKTLSIQKERVDSIVFLLIWFFFGLICFFDYDTSPFF